MVQDELGVTEDELVKLFIEHLEKKAKEYVPPEHLVNKYKMKKFPKKKIRSSTQFVDQDDDLDVDLDEEALDNEMMFRGTT